MRINDIDLFFDIFIVYKI